MKKILLSLMVVGLLAANSVAANYYWDSDQTAAGNDSSTGANLGGTGTWDATTLNWWDPIASPGADIAWANGNNAIFYGTAGVVTIPVAETRSATGLAFKTEGYNLSAGGTTSSGVTARGTITLTGSPTIVVDSGVTGIITARLAGTAGFALSGGGTLRLAEPNSTAPNFGGLNSITGAVSVTSGSPVNNSNFGTVLEVIGGGQLGGSTGVITLNGGTYRNTDPTPTGSSFNFGTATARPFVIGTNGGVFDTPIATSIFLQTATITGTVGTTLTKTGPGEVRMSGAGQVNTFEKLVINEGRFTIGQATTLAQDTQLGAVPASYKADAVTLDGQASGAILRFAGGSGTTTATLNANRGITLGATYGGTNTFQVGDTNATIPGIITGPGALTKTGALLLTLGANNNYAGGTTINAGTVALSNTTGSGVGNGAVTVNSGGNLRILTSTGNQAIGGVTLNSGGVVSGTGTLAGSLSMATGAKITPGIGGANAVLTLPTADLSTGSILESTLGSAGASDVLKVSTASTGLNLNGGTFSLVPLAATNPSGQTYTLVDYTTGFTGSLSSMLINNQTGFDGVTVTNDVANHAIKVTIGTTVNERTWVRETDFGLWNNDAPPGPNESANWATPANVTPATAANGIGSIAKFPAVSPITSNPIGSQSVTITGFTKTVGTLTLDNPNQLTFISDATALKLNLQTYSGNALIDVKQGDHTIATGSGTGNTAGGALTFTSLTEVKVASGATLTLSPVANAGGMNKTGPGMLKITSSDWNGTGATNINEGTLQYADNNAAGLGNSSTITMAAAGTLDMNSASTHKVNDTIGALAGAGKFVNHGNVTLGGTNSTAVTFSGQMKLTGADTNNDPFIGTGTGTSGRAFVKNGTGIQIISASLESTSSAAGGNFNIASTVAAGQLYLNNPSGTSLTTSGATLSVSSGATLGGTGYIAGPVTIASGGILAPGSQGIGTLHLQAATALTLPVGATMSFELGALGVNDMIDAAASAISIATSTTTRVNLVNAGGLTAGTYTLIDYGTLTGTGGFGGLSLGTSLPTGFTYSLVNNTTNTTIDLVVTSAGLPGDFNNNGTVDAGDYAVWRKNDAGNLALPNDGGATTQAARFTLWRANFGKPPGAGSGSGLGSDAVPEPAAMVLALVGMAFAGMVRRRS